MICDWCIIRSKHATGDEWCITWLTINDENRVGNYGDHNIHPLPTSYPHPVPLPIPIEDRRYSLGLQEFFSHYLKNLNKHIKLQHETIKYLK